MRSPFRFQQFRVRHDLCGMPIGTDAVLLGAWSTHSCPARILDIGTGCGVIALMLAQRFSHALVDAIDIHPPACREAAENVSQSPWPERIRVHVGDIAEYDTAQSYDLIVSNPPWFSNSTTSGSHARDQARHTETLTYDQLFRAAARLLAARGSLCLIVPAIAEFRVCQLAEGSGLRCVRMCRVRPTADSPVKRLLLEFTPAASLLPHEQNREADVHELVIEPTRRHEYSAEFQTLTQDFYLRFAPNPTTALPEDDPPDESL